MVYREIASGELISLSNQFGQEPLHVALFADSKDGVAMDLLSLWSQENADGWAAAR